MNRLRHSDFLFKVRSVASLISDNGRGSSATRDEIADVYRNAEMEVVAYILRGAAQCEDSQ